MKRIFYMEEWELFRRKEIYEASKRLYLAVWKNGEFFQNLTPELILRTCCTMEFLGTSTLKESTLQIRSLVKERSNEEWKNGSYSNEALCIINYVGGMLEALEKYFTDTNDNSIN